MASSILREQLADCLNDNDYEELLQIMKNGLTSTPRCRVAIVGAGMAGMTAAKLLRDAGHEVS